MAEVKKKNKGNKAIWFVIGIVIIALIATLVVVFMKKEGTIKTTAQLRTAIQEKRAINCTISQPEGSDVVMQTNDGFGKVKLTVEESELAEGLQFVLMIDGDATYMWDEAGTIAYKMDDTSMLDSFVDQVVEATEEDDGEEEVGFTFKCESVSEADLEVPEDVHFTDLSEMYNNNYIHGGGDYSLGD